MHRHTRAYTHTHRVKTREYLWNLKKILLHFASKPPKCRYPRLGLSCVPLMLLFPAWGPDGSQRGLRNLGCKGRTRTMSDLPSQATPDTSTPAWGPRTLCPSLSSQRRRKVYRRSQQDFLSAHGNRAIEHACSHLCK